MTELSAVIMPILKSLGQRATVIGVWMLFWLMGVAFLDKIGIW